MPNGVVPPGQQGDERPKPPPLVATCLLVPPIRPRPEAAPPMASPLPPHTLPKRRAPSDMPAAPPPVHQGATLAVVQAYAGFEIVDSSSDDDDGFSILVNSVPRQDAKAGPTISPPPPTISLRPPAAPPKPPHPSSPSNGGPSGAAVEPSAALGVGSARGKVGSGMGRGLGKTGGPMKWQRPLTKPRSPVVPPLPSTGTPAARGLAAKKAFPSPVPSATKAVRGFGSSYTRMGHSYTLVRAPLPFPPITSPLPSSAPPAPSVLPPAAPLVSPISDAKRVEGSRGGAAEAPPAAEKYSRKRANQLVRGGSTPRKNGPSSTSLQATSGPVEAQVSVGAKQSVAVKGAEKPMLSSKPSPPPTQGGPLLISSLSPPLPATSDAALCFPRIVQEGGAVEDGEGVADARLLAPSTGHPRLKVLPQSRQPSAAVLGTGEQGKAVSGRGVTVDCSVSEQPPPGESRVLGFRGLGVKGLGFRVRVWGLGFWV